MSVAMRYERLILGFVGSFAEVTFEVLELIDAGDYVITSTVLHAVPRGQESDRRQRHVRLRLHAARRPDH